MPNPYDFMRQARADAGFDGKSDRPEVTVGGAGEFVGKTLNTAATLPRQGFNVVNEAAIKPARNVLSDFGGGVMRGAGYGGSGMPEAQANVGAPTGAEAFRGGRGPGYGDVSGFVDDKRPDERARHDPMTGNPQGGAQDFMKDATDQAMSDNPVAYTGSGDFGAPGSSGTPGPGGTVNTISAEAFMNPGGKAAGDAAAGRAKRDFQLRQEGNAGLASDATPEEKIEFKRQKLKQDMQNLDMGMGQSFSSLAKNKHRAKMIQREMARLDRQEQGQMDVQTAAAERGFEAQESQLDRQADLQKAAIENVMGGNLKVGGTQEAIKNKMVNEGFDSLTPEENFLVTEKIREQAISDLSKENFGEPVTQDQIKERMDLMLGQLKQAASGGADDAADKLAGMGLNDLPSRAQDALKQGKAVKYQGTTYAMGQDGTIQPVSQ